MRAIERRLRVLEGRKGSSSTPNYLSVADESEIAAALANVDAPVKVYIGISPDDWDSDNEKN